MRFVINGLGLVSGGGLTVGLNVVRCLSKVDRENQYLLVFPPGVGYEDIPLGENCRMMPIGEGLLKHVKRLYVDHVQLPRVCREFRADALFSMSNFGPRKTPCPQMVGIHRPHLAYPESVVWSYMPLKQRLFARSLGPYFAWASRNVSVFCVLTDVIGKRLQRIYQIPETKIRVIPNAISQDTFARDGHCPQIQERLAPHDGCLKLCYVALGYVHKNHKILIDAMRILRRDLGIRNVTLITTIEAGDSTQAPAFLEAIEGEDLKDCIVNLGRVPFENVPAVYANSDAILMPTLLEAYSISYIEAMYFGLPILTSDMDFAHAVCDNAALYFDPMDATDVARAIAQLHEDESLRCDLVERGCKRLSLVTPSWEEVTRRYVAALHETAETASQEQL